MLVFYAIQEALVLLILIHITSNIDSTKTPEQKLNLSEINTCSKLAVRSHIFTVLPTCYVSVVVCGAKYETVFRSLLVVV